MDLGKKLATLKLAYADPNEEAEYDQTTRFVLKDFLTYLLICVIIVLIPLAVHLFVFRSLYQEGGMTVAMIVLAALLFLARKVLSKWLEYLVMIYLILGVILVIVNLNRVLLSFHSCEAFYAGYAFALFHRTLGYRIIKTSSMIIFHIISLIFRLIFLYDHDISVTLMAVAMEILTIALSVKSEKGERALFHSLYNSKKALIKFKDFLMEHLPNQMVIFSKDYNGTCLTNTAFRQSFKCDDLYQLKCSLKTLIIERESIQKNMTFFARLGFIPDKRVESISLSQFLWLMSKNFDLLRESQVISFDVFEDPSQSMELPIPTNDEEGFKIKIQRNDTDSPLTEKKFKRRTFTSLIGGDSDVYKEKLTFLKEQHAPRTERLFNTRNYSKELEGLPFSPGGRYSQEKAKLSNTSDTKKRILKVKVFLLQWDGEEVMATMLDDVTQQKSVAESRLADMNKELVLEMANKEMTYPVNNMLGLIDIAKKKTMDHSIVPYLTACKNNGILLLNIANSILDLARAKNEKLKLVYSKLSLKGMLMELTSIFQPFCQIKDLYFKTEMPANVPDIFITDKTRLYQVLTNLISNAVKTTFEGGITLKIELDSHVPLKVRFTVRDTGLGIRKEDQEKIFRIYRRSETPQAETNIEDNTIGLTASNMLVSLLSHSDGKGITVESELNEGCTFTFTLECKSRNSHDERRSLDTSIGEIFSFSEDEEEGLPSRNKEAPYMSVHGENIFTVRTYENIGKNKDFRMDTKKSENYAGRSEILETKESKIEEDNKKPWCLVVDDDPYHLMVAKFYIEERGFRVKTALNGKEAVSMAIEHHGTGKAFKFILMDCQMPIMNGYEATKALRKMMKAKKISECPIFACVEVNSEVEDEMSRKEAGMLGALMKPLHEADIEHLSKKLTRGSSS